MKVICQLVLVFLLMGSPHISGLRDPKAPPRKPPDVKEVDETQRRLLVGLNKFTLDAYNILRHKTPHGNVLFSPLGIWQSLESVFKGLPEEQVDKLFRAMNLPDIPRGKFNTYIQIVGMTLLESPPKGSDFELHMHKHLYVSDQFELDSHLKARFDNHKWAKLESLDFSKNPLNTTKHIMNTHMEKASEGRIKDIAQDGDISEDSRLVLMNGNSFSGKWEFAFKHMDDVLDFTTSAGEVFPVRMMYLQGLAGVNFHPHIGCQIITLPYQGERLNFVALVPMQRNANISKSEDDLVNRLALDRFSIAPTVPRKLKVKLHLPAFTMSQHHDLKDLLMQLDLHNLTNPSLIDFQKMAGSAGDVYLTGARQESMLKIGPEGKEEAFLKNDTKYGKPDPLDVKLNRPFMFFVADHITETILFFGKFEIPPPDIIVQREAKKDEL